MCVWASTFSCSWIPRVLPLNHVVDVLPWESMFVCMCKHVLCSCMCALCMYVQCMCIC